MTGPRLAEQLRHLADQVDDLAPGEVIGTLEKLKCELLISAIAAPAAAAVPSVALDVEDVVRRTGMSRCWLYRQARAGRLPFARRMGRRLVFDEAGLERWLARRAPK